MDQDISSSRPDSTNKSSAYQNQRPPDPAGTNADSSTRRVRVYDRPNRPAVQSDFMMGTILMLIAIAAAVYFLFFSS